MIVNLFKFRDADVDAFPSFVDSRGEDAIGHVRVQLVVHEHTWREIKTVRLSESELKDLVRKLNRLQQVIRHNPDIPYPSLADARGAFPNFTDGKSAVEYLDEVRGE